jgi:hypothetical protein
MQSIFYQSLSGTIFHCLSALERVAWRYLALSGKKFRVQFMNIDRKPASGFKKAVHFA